jgi:hypothetical protein
MGISVKTDSNQVCLKQIEISCNDPIVEFQLIFELRLDELHLSFMTSCLDIKKERNSDGGMTLYKGPLQQTHSIRRRRKEKVTIHRLWYNRQRRLTSHVLVKNSCQSFNRV